MFIEYLNSGFLGVEVFASAPISGCNRYSGYPSHGASAEGWQFGMPCPRDAALTHTIQLLVDNVCIPTKTDLFEAFAIEINNATQFN